MRYITLISFILIITACGRQKSAPDAEQLVMSSLWFQNSAEARALYYQAYNIARLRIELALDTLDDNNKYAVVADIDETILDNSPSEARNILEGERYSNERWMAWTSEAKAQLMPGSLDFANFLKDRGVELYYISNRSVDEKDVTLANLKKFGFPFADDKHVLLKEEESSKTPRRTLVEESHQIILLLGDNLNDFSDIFENRSEALGFSTVDQVKNLFGSRFIVLPNPIYGSWTRALFGPISDLSPRELARHRKNFLSDY